MVRGASTATNGAPMTEAEQPCWKCGRGTTSWRSQHVELARLRDALATATEELAAARAERDGLQTELSEARACPVCGCEQRDHRELLVCRCPDPKATLHMQLSEARAERDGARELLWRARDGVRYVRTQGDREALAARIEAWLGIDEWALDYLGAQKKS